MRLRPDSNPTQSQLNQILISISVCISNQLPISQTLKQKLDRVLPQTILYKSHNNINKLLLLLLLLLLFIPYLQVNKISFITNSGLGY